MRVEMNEDTAEMKPLIVEGFGVCTPPAEADTPEESE
jgi:hypothetical protein